MYIYAVCALTILFYLFFYKKNKKSRIQNCLHCVNMKEFSLILPWFILFRIYNLVNLIWLCF